MRSRPGGRSPRRSRSRAGGQPSAGRRRCRPRGAEDLRKLSDGRADRAAGGDHHDRLASLRAADLGQARYAAKPGIPRTPSAVVTGALPGSSLRTVEPFCTPYFCHPVYGVQLWMPEAGGRVDYASGHDERAMTVLGLSSKREIARTSIRVRTAMAAQTREQGRYLGGRPPYGTGWPMPGRIRIRRMPPGDPRSPAGVRPADGACRAVDFHAAARGPFGGADRAGAKRGGISCPSAADPERNPTAPARHGRWARLPRSWATRGTPAIRYGTGSGPTSTWLTRPTPVSGISRCSGGTCPMAGLSPASPPPGASQRGRLHRRPGHQRLTRSSTPRRPGRAGEAPVPARQPADMRRLRQANGIRVVQRQACMPVPPRPRQRNAVRPRAPEERLCPRRPHSATPARLAPAADQNRASRGAVKAPHSPRDRRQARDQPRGNDRLPCAGTRSRSPGTRPPEPYGQAQAKPQSLSSGKQASPGREPSTARRKNKNAGRPALAVACARVTSRPAREQENMGNYSDGRRHGPHLHWSAR